jgi:hypothetical protein
MADCGIRIADWESLFYGCETRARSRHLDLKREEKDGHKDI